MAIRYDPNILQKYAEILYRQARIVVIFVTALFAFFGILPGLAIGGILAQRAGSVDDRNTLVVLVALAVCTIFAAAGFIIGQAIAFWYRLRGQLTLCQKQIEVNTRIVAHAYQQSSSPSPEIVA